MEETALEAGLYLALLHPTSPIWVEYIVCSRIVGSQYIVISPELQLEQIDLATDTDEYVVGAHAHDRPILIIAEAMQTHSFDNSASGGPLPAHILIDMLAKGNKMAVATARHLGLEGPDDDSAEFIEAPIVDVGGFVDSSSSESYDDQAHRLGWLRGGADTRRRITGKSKVSSPDLWVLRDAYDRKHSFGARWDCTSSFKRVGHLGLDKHPKTGDIVILELVAVRRLGMYRERRELEIRHMLDLTPGGVESPEDALAPAGRRGAGLSALEADAAGEDAGSKSYYGAGLPLPASNTDDPPKKDDVGKPPIDPGLQDAGPPLRRILNRVFGIDGVPRRDMVDTVRTMTEDTVGSWPLTGPRSVLWVLTFIVQQCQTSCLGRMHQFMQMAKLSFSDKYMTEYAVICRTLEYAITFDQLHVSNLVCFELLARRLQLIEEKYRFRLPQFEGGSGAGDPENDHGLFLGLGTSATAGRSAVMVMPALTAYVGEELAKEAAITKGKVKAHELREQIKKLNGGGPKKPHGEG